ncbi:LDLR chaperone boca [Teleopsis dalmanni]|uniref:LDLR chaperone boca-like n=1 Tax=Teleopsis dalmanni TaxID=139649 RepID=UPI000D32C083|nr:LDLR chaperone boca-like [Teleopsis dalmanni]XP_037951231.1 LDLR chaperone boca [Teleopsis dalmanni]
MRLVLIFVILITISTILAKKSKDGEKPEWAKKDIRDYSDADFERLLDQWEEGDDELEADELPEHLRPQAKLDLTKLDPNNPEEILKASKKGRTLMTFVSVGGNPTRDEAESITKLWQTSLWNNHIQAERYMVDDDRAIFMFKDGEQAWRAKDFLIQQERCKGVTIENKEYPGVYAETTDEKDEL